MSNAANDVIYENMLECFQESIMIEEISMKNVIVAMNAGEIKKFPDLHDALWNFDAELYCHSIDQALEAYILYKRSMKQLKRMTRSDYDMGEAE